MKSILRSLEVGPWRVATQARRPYVLVGAALGFATLTSAQYAGAYKNGTMTTVCSDCHGNGAASLEVRFEPEAIEPGETTTLVIAISANDVAGAGMAVRAPAVGEFNVPSTEPIRLQDGWAMHSGPKESSNGVVEFLLDWTAPSEPGVATFEVAAVAANLDNARSGDRTAKSSVSIAFGCEASTLYWDADGDGVGRSDSSIVYCGEKDRYSTLSGDCNDDNDEIYPGGPELCNEVDDDCDGEVDDNCGQASSAPTGGEPSITAQTAPTFATSAATDSPTALDSTNVPSSNGEDPDSSLPTAGEGSASTAATTTIETSHRETPTAETTNMGDPSAVDATDKTQPDDTDAAGAPSDGSSSAEGCTCRMPARPPRGIPRWALPILAGVILAQRRLRLKR